jgi:RHH-type transcriptional regulator, proline utilization regulon repressor / proline dehydrogenase / delta 1-pyrroline-5-carboxylate dehydrogenase
LPEQVVTDVLTSAFDSAGQRCSALRLLYLQEDIADRVLPMLAGAMAELTLGDPSILSTDVGPVIDCDNRAALQHHTDRMEREARLLFQCTLPADTENGTFFAPRAFQIDSARRLPGEVFGPILHVVRWRADQLNAVLDEIEATGYALTLGIHSRVDATVQYILGRLGVGNSYVNRNMIGAVVGVQPFGGERLSGTGPKAGGPRYLHRFATERTISIDITASGGNAALLSMEERPG